MNYPGFGRNTEDWMVVLVSALYGASASAYAGKTQASQSAFPRKRACNKMFHLLTYPIQCKIFRFPIQICFGVIIYDFIDKIRRFDGTISIFGSNSNVLVE